METPGVLLVEQAKESHLVEPYQMTCRSLDKKWTSNQLRLRKNLTT